MKSRFRSPMIPRAGSAGLTNFEKLVMVVSSIHRRAANGMERAQKERTEHEARCSDWPSATLQNRTKTPSS